MKTEIELIYRSKCEDLKGKVERIEDKLHKREEENRTLYQTIYEDFERRLGIKEEKWNEKIDTLRTNYEEKLALEKTEKESFILLHTHGVSRMAEKDKELWKVARKVLQGIRYKYRKRV